MHGINPLKSTCSSILATYSALETSNKAHFQRLNELPRAGYNPACKKFYILDKINYSYNSE